MQFIVDNIKPQEKLPEIMVNGSKVLVITFNNVKIIDSINFMPMALSKLPKTFGFKELKKGYFPHFFNIPSNQDYVGPYPEPKFYGAEYMSVKDNVEFLKWHKTKNLSTFDFKNELLDYCISDVDILSKACNEFRNLFKKITKKNDHEDGVDPSQLHQHVI